MKPGLEYRLAQAAVALATVVPIGAGLAGILAGPQMATPAALPGDVSLGSHFAYLSGLLLGIGLCFVALVPRLREARQPFALLTAIVFIGGLARLAHFVLHGAPSGPMLFGLAMELLVTPLLWMWQRRLGG